MAANGSVIAMSAPHPHSAADLALAPILISIERNLARLRGSNDLEYALALELNDDDSWYHAPAGRAERVRQAAVRGIDLHGWSVRLTEDWQGLAVTHGEYTVSLMLGGQLPDYVEHGLAAGHNPAKA